MLKVIYSPWVNPSNDYPGQLENRASFLPRQTSPDLR